MVPFQSFLRRIRHGLTLGVRVIVTDQDGRILLVRHSYTRGWHLPGGGVDVGENAEQAAGRELREEAGVDVTGPLRLIGVYFNARMAGRDHVVCYHAPHVKIGPRPKPNLEIRAAEFFPLDALPEGVTPATARRLAEWRQGLSTDPMW
ncbi:NUDIX domain-containing protein [Xanthobacter sp. TB0139]|uniref:NUDIX domain-containing protein n=1 Tax=Xanthobacter sp. TB0139 TaxID=3459178 RepID=UPI004039ACCB